VHYYPTYGYQENFDNNAKVDAIPPQWEENPTTQYEIPLHMHGTTMEEPICPNYWCNTKTSKKWSGPGEEGYVINPDGTKRVLDLSKRATVASEVICNDMHPDCSMWASWESDECKNNPGYMKEKCPRSCGICMHESISSDEL
jgi:hypothetical protein